jgi:hypothetical protein
MAVCLLLLAAACTQSAPPVQPAAQPGEQIPVPPGAQLVRGDDVATFHVADADATSVLDFYRETLPDSGWTIIDDWEGQDGHGLPSAGLIIERGEEVGAVAVTGQDDATVVRVNLRQPEYRAGGMNSGPRPPAEPSD